MKLKNPKAKGTRNERRTVTYLKEHYELPYAARVAGSLGPFDVIGLTDAGRAWLIQVKTWPIKKKVRMPAYIDGFEDPVIYVFAWKDWEKEPILHRVNGSKNGYAVLERLY